MFYVYIYVYSAPVPSEGSSKQGMNGPAKGEIALSLPPSLFSLIFLFVFYFYKYIYIYFFFTLFFICILLTLFIVFVPSFIFVRAFPGSPFCFNTEIIYRYITSFNLFIFLIYFFRYLCLE